MHYTYNTTNSVGDLIAGFKAGERLYDNVWGYDEWSDYYRNKYRRKHPIHTYEFRRGPVHGIHHNGGKRYFYRCYRQPQHLYIHKEYGHKHTLAAEIYEHCNRASLKFPSSKDMPNPYDDIPKSKITGNWKNYRKHQWKD